MKDQLLTGIIQSHLFWEDPERNLDLFSGKIARLSDPMDLLLLPEMFTTGFSMQPARYAEPMEGRTMKWMQDQAARIHAVVAGSLIIKEKGLFYNRFIWMWPDGDYRYYDKKHLFAFAGEDKEYTAGSRRMILSVKGWKIMPLICYDLRFPVWSRNTFIPEEGFAYDCLVYIANWPATRSHAWRVLLMGRAIENMSYVVGVNRIGTDGKGTDHSGDSGAINPMGESLSQLMPNKEQIEVVGLSRQSLEEYRNGFRAWADWDTFQVKD
jgi:omega-amidase